MELHRDAYPSEGSAARDPRSHHVLKRLQIIRDHADQLRQSAGMTADKVVGPQAPAALGGANGTTAPKAAGFFAELDDALSGIDSTLAAAIDNMRRLEREF